MSMELKTDITAKAIVPVLACVLNQLCARNDRLSISQKAVSLSKFHALRPPSISISDYLMRKGGREDLPRFTAVGASGRRDVAATHEEEVFSGLEPHGERGSARKRRAKKA